jgi:hypothetical protein
MECPRCTSTEFTKLSLLYEQGSSTFHARSSGLGLAIGTGGADLVLGQARTKGKIQTRLSNKVSPPRKWSYWKTVVGGLIGLLVLEFILGYVHTFLGYGGNFEQQLSWIGWSYFGFLVFLLGLAVWYNSRVFPKRYHAWDRSFMCRRCGRVVEVERSAPSQPHLAQEVRP